MTVASIGHLLASQVTAANALAQAPVAFFVKLVHDITGESVIWILAAQEDTGV